MEEILEITVLIIGLIGCIVIGWGVAIAVVSLVRLEASRLAGSKVCKGREVLRHHFGSYILLGLEFLIAADIVKTILEPTLEEIAVLGGIVAIRTVLNYFLNRELVGHKCTDEQVSKVRE